jgi:hypothetical protein
MCISIPAGYLSDIIRELPQEAVEGEMGESINSMPNLDKGKSLLEQENWSTDIRNYTRTHRSSSLRGSKHNPEHSPKISGARKGRTLDSGS